MFCNNARESPHHRRDVRPWEAPGEELLDLGLPPVSRRLHEPVDTLRGEMRRQEAHPSQMEPPFNESGEKDGEPPGGSGRLDPLQGRVLGQAQLPDTVRMHRWIAGRGVETTCVHLGDVSQHHRGGHTIAGDEGG
jgi:hypothetical protein